MIVWCEFFRLVWTLSFAQTQRKGEDNMIWTTLCLVNSQPSAKILHTQIIICSEWVLSPSFCQFWWFWVFFWLILVDDFMFLITYIENNFVIKDLFLFLIQSIIANTITNINNSYKIHSGNISWSTNMTSVCQL